MKALEIQKSLESFASLEDGWAGRGSLSYDKKSLNVFSQRFLSTYPSELPEPFISPAPDGNILLEWEESNDLSADIELLSGNAYIHGFSDKFSEKEAEVNFLDNPEQFYSIIASLLI